MTDFKHITDENVRGHGHITATLETAFDKGHAEYERFCCEHLEEDANVAVLANAAVHYIQDIVPLDTLGNLRLHTKVLTTFRDNYTDDFHDKELLRRLLRALAKLPERLWAEPIEG